MSKTKIIIISGRAIQHILLLFILINFFLSFSDYKWLLVGKVLVLRGGFLLESMLGKVLVPD
jgi:hypothetical protein